METERSHLDDRLLTAAACVRPGKVVADIGCDHGKLAIHLAREGKNPRITGADLRPEPLARAAGNLKKAGCEEKVELRLGDGLTDLAHPCQILADLMTIREYKGSLEGLKMCFIGDGNNMMNSLIVGCLKVGMSVAVACPEGYRPPQMILDFAAQYGDKFFMTDKPLEAAVDADVVITDVWTSMGQEEEKAAREAAFAGYQVNAELMSKAHSDAMVLHCLPAHREEEITAEVFEAHANEIFDEAENRLHAQKAVLVRTMKG